MRRWAAAVALVAAACGSGGGRSPSDGAPEAADRGHELYLEGKLDAAERELASVVARDPRNSFARRVLGRIQLLKGRHRESAEQFLSYVTLSESAKVPPDSMALQDLFWAFYRMDDYARASQAAGLLRDSVLAVKYGEMSRRGSPYTLEWKEAGSTLAFEGAAAAGVRINRHAGRFAIDLGAGEIVLNRSYAKEAGVRIAGIPNPGIEKDEQGIVEVVDLPGLQVRNVPVVVSEIRGAVDGVLGIGFLSHVQATVDLRRGRLVLRPAASPPREGAAWPLYFAGDRTLITPARIDGIDTFVIVNPTARGVSFIPSRAILVEKAQRSPQKPALERVDLGTLSIAVPTQSPEHFPPGVDIAYGFVIGGLVGADAFRNKAVTFDFRAMRITVE